MPPHPLASTERTGPAGRRTSAVPGRSALRIGVVTALPPGRNSLNEFGFHLVKHLATVHETAEVVVYADETDAGPPATLAGARNVACWKFNDVGNLWRIVGAVRATKPDAVIFNLQFATFGDQRVAGGLGLLTPAVLRMLGVPSVVILHNLSDNVDMRDAGFAGNRATAWLMRTAGKALTRALLRANLVAVTIPRYVELLNTRYGARNAVLAPHGSFEELAMPSFDVPPGKRRILAFGKWGTYKTVDTLVEAYQELLRTGHDDLELVIGGSDSPNSPGYLDSVAKRYADVPGIVYTGYVAEDDVPALFRSASVVAFPYTSTTGSSGVLHQAGEYGRAVALPRIGDFVEIIEEEGFRGTYFEPGDPVSLAGAMAEVLDDDELREDLGRRNFAAATGIPMSEVVQWHVMHINRILQQQRSRR
ncbi:MULTISPECIES: glycosyltransferase [Actinoplanes]|uniref:glycosyltransferase n=1 Tax=Actinoplanes TaxID=1865 RepID=UPI000698AB78|nr:MULTISPECIES: glycosyltransferase [Actinoplanes]GLX99840.1 glycosyl transferase family 1 [Actinoplanes sp. NBRC 101535]